MQLYCIAGEKYISRYTKSFVFSLSLPLLHTLFSYFFAFPGWFLSLSPSLSLPLSAQMSEYAPRRSERRQEFFCLLSLHLSRHDHCYCSFFSRLLLHLQQVLLLVRGEEIAVAVAAALPDDMNSEAYDVLLVSLLLFSFISLLEAFTSLASLSFFAGETIHVACCPLEL